MEHEFIFLSLEKCGLGELFCSTIKTLYMNGNSSIKLKHGISPRFDLKRGIRQGRPISPYLFLLATQLLTSSVKSSNIEGISIDNAWPHDARICTQFLEAEHVPVLPWPVYSPDVSPIDHVWDALDQRVPVPANIQKLRTAIEAECDNIP